MNNLAKDMNSLAKQQSEQGTPTSEAQAAVVTSLQKSFRRRSNWQLALLRFREHRLAMAALGVIAAVWLVCVLFAEFFAPYSVTNYSKDHVTAPPQIPRFVDENGQFHLRPFVYGLVNTVDQKTARRTFSIDMAQKYPFYFFVRGEPYKLWGLFELDWRLFGTTEGGFIYLFGGDSLGRDIFSRIIYGGRVSLTVGLLGVMISMILGAILGITSGLFGGAVDTVIQRIIEVMMSFPAIPLWMALTAAMPANWSSIQVYFAIVTLLGLLSWGSLARQIRGQVLSLREREFIQAARSIGAPNARIILVHLLPNVLNQIIVITTLTIPWVILSETSLSFLGLGIRPPLTSWGVLLEEAQNVQAIRYYPWFVIPSIFVIVTMLAYNFLGDGLRDAFEPRS